MTTEMLLLIAAAVGAVWYFNRATGQGFAGGATVYKAPSFTPTPAPAPVAAPVAMPSTTSVSNLPLIAVLILAAILGYSAFKDRLVTPLMPEGTGILGKAFSTNDDRAQASRDAKRFGKLCLSLGDAIEDDAKLAKPFFSNGVQLDDLRRRARIYMFRGGSLQARYPDLPTAVDSFMTARVGTSGGPLDNEQRRKWVAALRELGGAAEQASK